MLDPEEVLEVEKELQVLFQVQFYLGLDLEWLVFA